MSVEGQVLGASTVAGGGAGAVSTLADTGNPILVGVVTSLVLIVVLGMVTRMAQRKQSEEV